MKWYEGGIAQAVAVSKQKGAVFVVFIEGSTDVSKSLSEVLGNETISSKLENGNFIAIKIEENSIPHQQFSQIYKEAVKPSLFFIGKNGVPLDIISRDISATELIVKLDEITQKNAGPSFQSSSGGAPSENLISAEQSSSDNINNRAVQKSEKENKDQPKRRNSGARKSPVSESSSPSETPLVQETSCTKPETSFPKSIETENNDKAKVYQEIIEKKKEKREVEEKEKEKDDELQRRKMGQDVQKLKRWQDEEDLKQLVEQREKEKREDLLARKRVLAQIAQDKAERAAKFANSASNQSPVTQQTDLATPPSKPNTNTARLQLKLPDGSSHTHEFASSDTLQDVREFISSNLNMTFRTYTLSTTFPRREFSENDYSQTLADLQLVPNAVVLVLPVNQRIVSTRNSGLFSSLWFFFTPFFTLFLWLKSRVMDFFRPNEDATGNARGPPRANLGNWQNTPQDKQSSGNTNPTVPGKGSFVRREGNVHRLVDKKDDDDENNTWNGNSTQQM